MPTLIQNDFRTFKHFKGQDRVSDVLAMNFGGDLCVDCREMDHITAIDHRFHTDAEWEQLKAEGVVRPTAKKMHPDIKQKNHSAPIHNTTCTHLTVIRGGTQTIFENADGITENEHWGWWNLDLISLPGLPTVFSPRHGAEWHDLNIFGAGLRLGSKFIRESRDVTICDSVLQYLIIDGDAKIEEFLDNGNRIERCRTLDRWPAYYGQTKPRPWNSIVCPGLEVV